jgi:FkbM family methyltransferase
MLGGVEARFLASNWREPLGLGECLREEEDFLKALTAKLRAGDVFYDIGSNIGEFVIPLAKFVTNQGQVIAFEPEARACERLRSHIGLNGLTNVRVFQKGLGDANQSGELFVGGKRYCPSLLPQEGDSDHLTRSEAIEVVRGDWLVQSQALPIPRAIKIDVEGYEYSVLRGLEQTLAHPACELLCCEIHPAFLPPGVTAEMVVKLVESKGLSQVITHPRSSNRVHLIASKEFRTSG